MITNMKITVLILLLSLYILFTDSFDVKLAMPNVMPDSEDQYLCAAFPVPDPGRKTYIKSYESTTNSSIAHHILLYGCSTPYSTDSFYPCVGICGGSSENILFAWANNAKKFTYPSDVSMPIGGKTGINYFVMQVHYLKKLNRTDNSGLILTMTHEPSRFVVGIFLVFSYYGIIPPHTAKAHLDVSCKYNGEWPAYAFAFRTHAHTLSRSIVGYRVSATDDNIEFIGKGNPQWPQTFYKAAHVAIKKGDTLMTRCIYDSTDQDRETKIGATHHDEMCNYYIMVVTENTGGSGVFFSCGGNEYKDLWKNVPSDSMDYAAPNPSSNLMLGSTFSYLGNQHTLMLSNWKVQRQMGDISGVSIYKHVNHRDDFTLLVLHRADNSWDVKTFKNNIYTGDTKRPISENTIFEVDSDNGKVLREDGKNMFFMPHGITVTPDSKYVWITDVALHQAMRFPLASSNSRLMSNEPDIIIGEKFVPGNDRNHLCKPAQVAVDSKGNIFIADGYCNSRVICFYPNGTYADEWRTKDDMSVVHSITIEEDKNGDINKNTVWVADRENSRIIGFSYSGRVKFTFPVESGPVYGLKINSFNKYIYGVSSDGYRVGNSFTVNTNQMALGLPWSSKGILKAPHDLCIALNGSIIFVAELYQRKVLKFVPEYQKDVGIHDHHKHLVITSNLQSLVNRNSLYIGLLSTLIIFLLLLCLFIVKFICRYKTPINKKRKYRHTNHDKDGFQPLTQEEPDDNDNSDQETEEFTVPKKASSKKAKI